MWIGYSRAGRLLILEIGYSDSSFCIKGFKLDKSSIIIILDKSGLLKELKFEKLTILMVNATGMLI